MAKLVRAAGLVAVLMLAAAPRTEAQSSSIRVTIAGGPHTGTHEMADQCEVSNGQIKGVFTSTGGTLGDGTPAAISFYTVPGKGKPDGFGVQLIFLSKLGQQIEYEIHVLPPGLQGPMPRSQLSGRGSVTVRQAETGQTATFRGETKDGVRLEGSVGCRNDGSVMD